MKFGDVLIFVTDRDKCMNNKSEIRLMQVLVCGCCCCCCAVFVVTIRAHHVQKTIADLKVIERTTERITPIVVVINKMECGADMAEDVREIIEQCKRTVTTMMNEGNCGYFPLVFVPMSAQSLYLYR